MIAIQQSTSPPGTHAALAPALPLRATSPRPLRPTSPAPSTLRRPTSPAISPPHEFERSRAERSLLTLLERSANSPPAPLTRATSPSPSPRRHNPRPAHDPARDSLLFDVDLATLVERSIALQASPPRRAPSPRSVPRRPRPHFSTSPSSASPVLTDSDSDCPTDCACELHTSSVPTSGGMALAGRPRRSTLPERMKPDIPPMTPAEAVGSVSRSMRKAKTYPQPHESHPHAPPSPARQPQAHLPSARVQVYPATPLAAPQPRHPGPQWRPAVPKRAPSPAHPPRASHAALQAAMGRGTSPHPRAAPSPRPTTPSNPPSGSRGSPRAGTTNVSVTNINVRRASHIRAGSAGHLPAPNAAIRPLPATTRPAPAPTHPPTSNGRPPALDTDASRSWPATAAGPLLSPPPLEAEAFDIERAARRLRATEGRVNFDEIVPPPAEEERPRLGGRRWSLW